MITLNETGVVEQIEQKNNLDQIYGLEFYSGILIPAMVNAHAHLELSHLGGATPIKEGFVQFAKSISASRALFSEQQCRNAMEFYDAKMWSEGIGVVGDISNAGSSFEIKEESKIKYHTFLELFGLNYCDINRVKELRSVASQRGLSSSLTVHSTYSLNCADFDSVVGEDVDGILSIHFMESSAEKELYRAEGELFRWYEERDMKIDFDKYKSPVDRVVSTVPASKKVVLIHNTTITEEDIVALKEHFKENLTFVVCPRSNLYITDRKPPFQLLLDSGCRIAIGTDSMASNHSLSMIDEMKEIENIPLEIILKWATIAGAEALGVEDRYGKIDIGKSCGITLLESVDLIDFKLTPNSTSRRIV